MYELTDKVVLITGAANGIGAGVVRLLLKEGAKHVAILDVDQNSGVDFQNKLNSEYGVNRAKFYKCDVTNDDQLFGAFKSVIAEEGYIDVVINNAGIMNDSLKLYKKQIDINVTALITSTLKALEVMRKDEGGRGGTVINVSSIIGLIQSSFMPVYSATKSAVLQFSNCIGKQDYYKSTGVRVVAVCFGATQTALISDEKLGSFEKAKTPEVMSGFLKTIPIQEMESAARGVVDTYKSAESGSTWVVTRDLPAKDITNNIDEAYKIMGEHI